jgi:ankyrin repeat protein
MHLIRKVFTWFAVLAVFLLSTVSLSAQETLFELLESNANEQELWEAAEALTVEEVHDFVDNGGDPDVAHRTGGTALMMISGYGSHDVLEALIDAGADVNATDSNGFTPLIVGAVLADDPDIIATLIEAGADVDAESADGMKAADFAERNDALRGTAVHKRLRGSAD